jgi:rhamnosyl/mannosyltransferase
MFKMSATMISPAMIFKLRRIQRDYDIIHIHHPDPMACLSLYLSGYRGKVVLHWHSDILKQKMLLRLYKPLQKWLIRRADIIVGTTPVYVQQSPFLKKVHHKINNIPIGINELNPNPDTTAAIRAQYSGKTIVFSLGRLVEYKGYEYLIKAAKYLDENYIILIGGNGPLQAILQHLIDELGVADRVELLGYVQDNQKIASCFMACDIFCLSSIWKTEAFGIVQIEAMSCGKPVVATRIPESGVSWVNEDGVSGYNVEPEHAEALAVAFKRIMAEKQLYAALSVGARQRYETMFTQEKMIDKCLSLYQELEGKSISLPNDSFFKEVKLFLDEGKHVLVKVKGSSMRPFLHDGDTVELMPATDGAVRWGAIVLAYRDDYGVVLHRVIKRRNDKIWLRGDAQTKAKEEISLKDVWAYSETAYRRGKRLKLNSFMKKCALVSWFLLTPFRGVILKLSDKINF